MAGRRPDPRWIDRVVVEAVHLDLIRAHGGVPGLRDEHALEAALARPRQRLAYRADSDLAALAAAYAYGLARDHPFHDGNKRIAFVAMVVFLELNGLAFKGKEDDVVAAMVTLAAGRLSEDELAAWLRERTAQTT